MDGGRKEGGKEMKEMYEFKKKALLLKTHCS